MYGIKDPGFCVCCPSFCSKHTCAKKGKFEDPKSARFSSVSRELKGFNKVYMPLATRNFKNIILLIVKDKVASTPCGFFRCAKLFSHKNKVATSPKSRDFHKFFSFCGSPRAPPYREPSKYSLSFINITSVSKTTGCWCVQTFFSANKQGFTSPKSARFSSVFSLNFLHRPNV